MPEIKLKSSSLILLVIMITVLVLVINSTFRFLSFQKYGELDEVASLISSNYVDTIEKEKLIRNGITGMTSDLDPYSYYLDKKELSGLLEESKGEFQGLGMEISVKEGYPVVISPIEDGPASKAGIKTGDKIVKIGNQPTKGLTSDQAQQKLRGPKGSRVKFAIVREGISDTLEFNLRREVIEIKSVSFSGVIEDGIGYVRLTRFSENAPSELKEALKELKDKNIKGLILDLRGNPGGLLQEAVGAAELFLKKGESVVEIRGRRDSDNRKFQTSARPIFENLPLIVLVNYGSASASEILAGAIQDQDRGLILGDTSYGKGAVQTVFELRGKTALKLTTAKYFLPSGRLIQKNRESDKNSSEDTVFAREQRAMPQQPSETKVYYTKKGRKVYGGGGIVPDILSPDPVYPPLLQKIFEEGYFFDYAVHYTATHPDIPENFQADEKVLNDFKKFISSKDLKYTTVSETQLEKLKQAITQEAALYSENGSASRTKEALDRLASILEQEKKAEFEKEKIPLKWQIEEAILTTKFGSKARYKLWPEYQEQIKRAVEILKNMGEYEKLLSATPKE
ncbi:MAG TPA: S41 family peptidase [Terriglobales bacterium]|nr:S41 family peptidase [Terriglobales bacterium]